MICGKERLKRLNQLNQEEGSREVGRAGGNQLEGKEETGMRQGKRAAFSG